MSPAFPGRVVSGVPGIQVKGQVRHVERAVRSLITENALLFTLKFGRMLKYLLQSWEPGCCLAKPAALLTLENRLLHNSCFSLGFQ